MCVEYLNSFRIVNCVTSFKNRKMSNKEKFAKHAHAILLCRFEIDVNSEYRNREGSVEKSFYRFFFPSSSHFQFDYNFTHSLHNVLFRLKELEQHALVNACRSNSLSRSVLALRLLLCKFISFSCSRSLSVGKTCIFFLSSLSKYSCFV